MWVLTGGRYTSLAKHFISESMCIADSPVHLFQVGMLYIGTADNEDNVYRAQATRHVLYKRQVRRFDLDIKKKKQKERKKRVFADTYYFTVYALLRTGSYSLLCLYVEDYFIYKYLYRNKQIIKRKKRNGKEIEIVITTYMACIINIMHRYIYLYKEKNRDTQLHVYTHTNRERYTTLL